MHNELASLQLQLNRQKQLLLKLIAGMAVFIMLLILFLLSAFKSRPEAQVIRAKGIIIVDEQGRERILIGAPLPAAKNRVRTDTARVRKLWSGEFPDPDQYMQWYKNYNHQSNGILILDEQGFDKLCLGDGVPDANVGQRIGKQTGLIFCDSNGSERGGLGIIELLNGKKRVLLALDGDNGMDATGISVLENGKTGFFSSAPEGFNMFLGSAPADRFFGLTVNQKKDTFYGLNLVKDSARIDKLKD